jgi:putative membrane protein
MLSSGSNLRCATDRSRIYRRFPVKIASILTATAATLTVITPAYAQVMTPGEYIMIAGASDLYERQSSQIVLSSTTDPKVRDFATMMIEHHTKSTEDVKTAARAAKLKVAPPTLMPAQAEMIAQLNAESGPARDAAYLAQQKAAHGQALAVQQAYAREGTSAPLRSAAGAIVPVVEHHIMMLKAM